MIKLQMKIIHPSVNTMTIIPKSMSIVLAWIKAKEKSNNGKEKMVKRSLRFLYLSLLMILGSGVRYWLMVMSVSMMMSKVMKIKKVMRCVRVNEVSM
jgi:hypothetical protein